MAERFGLEVSEPVRLHVEAKRNFCSIDVSYHGHLSATSTYTLAKQGGAMSKVEAAEFSTLAHFEDASKLRRLEDGFYKLTGAKVPSLDRYKTLLLKLCLE